MKKEVKKLKLSRETLRDLKDSETRQVVGGDAFSGSCQTVSNCANNNNNID